MIFITGVRTDYVTLLLIAEVSCQVTTVESGSHFRDGGKMKGRQDRPVSWCLAVMDSFCTVSYLDVCVKCNI